MFIKKWVRILLYLLLGATILVAAYLPVCPVVADTIPSWFYLSPSEGLHGSVFVIKGNSFTKNRMVNFYFSSDAGDTHSSIDNKITSYRYLGSVWTDDFGVIDNDTQPASNWAVYPVPFLLDNGTNKKNTPAGTCYVYATYDNSKSVVAFALFKVDDNGPEIAPMPTEGVRGSTVRIKGSTFTPTTVEFYFSGDVGDTSSSIDGKITAYKFLGSVWTDSGGFINNDAQPAGNQAVYPVPFRLDDGSNKKNTPGGVCYFYATYINSKTVIAFAKFTVTSLATMSIAPDTGFVGDTVSLTGSNFGLNENATAKLDDRDLVIPNGNRTTSGGEFRVSAAVPSLQSLPVINTCPVERKVLLN